MYPVSKSILLDGIEQRLLFPAGPSSLCLGTPEREPTAVDLLVAVPSPVITDLCARREALRAQLDIGAVGAAKPQVRNVRQAVNAVLLPQVGHVAWLLLLVVGGRSARLRTASLAARPARILLVNIHERESGRFRLARGPSFQDNRNKTKSSTSPESTDTLIILWGIMFFN